MLQFLDFLRTGEIGWLTVAVRLVLAVFCGGFIGLERERKRRPAGFRTHILICLGAAMTTLTSQFLALNLGANTDTARLGAQVIAGVGFIGAGTIIVTKLINQLMYDGKRGVAQTVCYNAFEQVAEKTGKEALECFEQAMENIMPELECKSRRVGGATYQVPMEVRPERRQTLGLRWLTLYARQRNERTMRQATAECQQNRS